MTEASLALLLIMLIACSAAAGVEHLGQPCKAKNILAGIATVDPRDGREYLVITNTNESSGMELIFIDFEGDKAKAFKAPAGSGSWALKRVSGDRLIVGTYYDGKFMVFDLKRMEFTKTIEFPGESYIWNLAQGSDGRIYGGTYGGGKLGALNLEDYTVEDLGAPAPPNLYLRNVCSLPDGRVFCNFGMEKPTNMIFEPGTKKYTPAPDNMQGMTIGASWNGYFLAGNEVFDGKTLEKVAPPFPVPPADGGDWSVITNMTTDEALFLRQKNAIYRYVKGDKDLKMLADMDLRGGGFLASSKSGKLLAVRGQDYCVVSPGDKNPAWKTIPTESAPRPIMFLEADDRGRVWGGPHFGQTLFSMDTKTRSAVNTGKICDAGGEVYDVACKDGKIYAASYAGGDITYYDPELPWDQWNRVNPKPLADVGAKGYIRPVAGIRFGPDGKLYTGWAAKYGTYGGAIAITDPKTGSTDLIENPLCEQTISGLAVDEKCMYAGTSLEANGLPHKKGESPKFGVIDITSKKVLFEKTFDGTASVRSLKLDPRSGRLALVANGKLYVFDTKELKFIEGIPEDLPQVASDVAYGDGGIYYGNEADLYRFDMKDLKAEKVATLPAKINHVAIGKEGTVYVSCEADVYAVKKEK